MRLPAGRWAPLLILAAAGSFVLWTVWLGYVVLDIPVKRHAGGGAFWWESQFAELIFADSWRRLYIHRQAGTAYPEPRMQGWKTVEETLSYFDRRLKEHGWDRVHPGVADFIMPEARFLGEANLRANWRGSDHDDKAVIAAWPIGDTTDGFNVVLVTARPSFMRKLEDALD